MKTVFDAAVAYEVFRRENQLSTMLTASILLTGCFDVVHAGHVRMVEFARGSSWGRNRKPFVMIGVNSDSAVRILKGDSRPINSHDDRCYVMGKLSDVDIAFMIDDITVTETIEKLKPNFWVKGGDYSMETINSLERAAALSVHCEILFAPKVEGVSSTKIIERMKG